ncbi:hypothetical protein [Lentzea aerocolonigenes]|uniref:hypothetical protein n=1 Tax=Lentzea aerocolonigenes TaxID=68170 RepID=UPI0004C382C6|nr:hypothetical protein [Lentzea aerocolonigenes]MCP2244692.1 hypothetical protein [Lentzea aerocolonigenes]
MRAPDLAEVDLAVLFPSTPPEQLDRIRGAVSRLQPAIWDWFPGEACNGGQFSLTGVTCLSGAADDQVELELCVGLSSPAGETAVSATVGVWCWCPQDHGTHYVREVEANATTVEQLTAAIESVTDQLVRWRETASPDAEWWRAEAGLPLRRA